jgi:hypothetical protein
MGNFSLSSDTQTQSFPAQMARQMGTPFAQALIQPPGIGAAIGFSSVSVVVPSPLQSTVLEQIPPAVPANLSVPGLTLAEAVRMRPHQPLIDRSSHKQTALNLIVGARGIAYGAKEPLPTPLESAIALRPTLALVELGFAEALEAAVARGPFRLPDVNGFRNDYAKVVRDLRQAGARLVVLTIPNPLDTAHFSKIESASTAVKLDPGLLQELWTLRPDDLITANGLNEISFQVYAASMAGSSAIQTLPSGSILGADAANEIQACIQQLNCDIRNIAAAEGALVYDLCGYVQKLREAGASVGSRKLTGDYLGGLYSLNGYYPGAAGHALIANEILGLLNLEFGTSFPPVNAAAVLTADPVADYRKAPGPNWDRGQLTAPSPLPTQPPPPSAPRTEAPSPAPRSSSARADYVLQLPPNLEQVLPLNPAASYFGDALTAENCWKPEEIKWGSGGNLLFGGLAMMDSHLTGNIRIKFDVPVAGLTKFEVSFEDGLTGTDSVLAAPVFFRMPGKQQRIGNVPGKVSTGRLDLRTGEVDLTPGALTLYANFFNSALFALLRVNPHFPSDPLSFPGPYGSAYAKFEQRADGKLDFTFAGSTFVPLGDGTFFPLNFGGPSRQFASVPSNGTALHPHLVLTTKGKGPSPQGVRPLDIAFNTLQEFTLYSPVSSFGDVFTLDAAQLGGPALGRSRLLGRVQIQFGPSAGTSVPIAVTTTTAGGMLAPLDATPIASLFPGRLTPGPEGFDANLRFPLRTYSLNDLSVIDDPFDLSVGAIDLNTGQLIFPLLHRGFINQDLIFALLRVEPRTPTSSFFFSGPGGIVNGPKNQPTFRYFGQVHIPYPPGFLFPDPNLATGFPVVGGGALDPYLWIWAFQDSAADTAWSGHADRVLSSRGELFSYHFVIPGDPCKHRAEFEYENHSQDGKFRMHSLAWVGFGNSGTGGKDLDTLSFTCFGVWSKNGVERVVQAAAQISTSPVARWIGIQIDRAGISDADSPLPATAFPIPSAPTGK